MRTSNDLIHASWRFAPSAPRARSLVARLAALAGSWLHRARSRRALAALDERGLRDIGLTPGDARREAGRPFWR